MPNYDYVCAQCGHKEEIFQKMSDASITECPQCHQNGFKRKVGGGVGLQFKGSGFYHTDYHSKPPSSEEKPPLSKEKPASSPKGCGCGKSACSK